MLYKPGPSSTEESDLTQNTDTEVGSKRSIFGRGGTDDEYVLSFRDVIWIFRRRLWLIVLVGIVLTGGGVGVSLLQTPIYQASTKILVGQEPGTLGTPQGNVWSPDLLSQLTPTLVEGVKSRPLAENAINELGWGIAPDEFLGHLDAEQVSKTQFMTVSYKDPSPEVAQQAANAVGEVSPGWISQINPSSVTIYATVVEQAEKPETPISPDPLRNGLIGLALGLMLGMGAAIFLEYFADVYRSSETVE